MQDWQLCTPFWLGNITGNVKVYRSGRILSLIPGSWQRSCVMDLECQIGPKAVRGRVNNTRDGKTKLKALARESNKQNDLKYRVIGGYRKTKVGFCVSALF